MRVFVTGASGFIGSTVVPELILAGHTVIGLARSDASAAAVETMGAEVRRGDIYDLDSLRDAAADADAVVHLAFDHASMAAGRMADAVAADHAVVRAIGDALAGSGKTFVGIGALARTGDPQRDAALNASPRAAVARTILELTERDVRALLIGIPSVTHGSRDRHGFIPMMIRFARATGVSAYVGEGANRWPAGHVQDVARVYRLALEKAPAGSQLKAAAEPGIPVRDIAEHIARRLGIPAASVSPEQAADHFKGFPFAALDISMSNSETRELLGWEPVHPSLAEDLEDEHYFAAV